MNQSQRSELIAQLHHRLGDFLAGKNRNTNKQHKDAIRDLLLTSPDNMVTAMHEYVMADLTNDQYRFRTDFLMALNMAGSTVDNSIIHEFLIFKEPLLTVGQTPRDALAIIRSLHGYQQLPAMDNYAYSDEEIQRKAAALLTITTTLYKRYQRYRYQAGQAAQHTGVSATGLIPADPDPIELGLPLATKPDIRLIDDHLITLVTDQPHNAEEIAQRIIRERISDGALLRDIFTSKAQSLREGLI